MSSTNTDVLNILSTFLGINMTERVFQACFGMPSELSMNFFRDYFIVSICNYFDFLLVCHYMKTYPTFENGSI